MRPLVQKRVHRGQRRGKAIEQVDDLALGDREWWADMEQKDGSFQTRYWQPTFLPVFAADGRVEFVLHGADDVTAQMVADQT